MNATLRTSILLATVSLASVGIVAAVLHAGAGQGTRANAAVPARTSPVRGLVLAQPFTIAEPYLHVWRAEQPEVRGGWLLVLDVDPRIVAPRQMAMPVLLVGDQTAECVNFGDRSGRVIAVVPAPIGADGAPAELAGTTAWFASPELPERVDAGWIAAERARAAPADLATFAADEIDAARTLGGSILAAPSRVELDRRTARLILDHSPQERELAESLLVPLTK